MFIIIIIIIIISFYSIIIFSYTWIVKEQAKGKWRGNLNKVFRLQKHAASVILNADTRANSVDLFRELNWLPFFHEAKINQCALVYKHLNGVCPDYMLELPKRNIDIRSTERQSGYGSLNLICRKYKRESEGARTFQVSATRFWNSLPNEIKCSSSLEILKKSLYKYFFF